MKIKNRQQLLTIVALGAIGLFAADQWVLSPLVDAWNARSKRLTDLRKKVGDGKQLLRREDALKARWDQMQTNALPASMSAAEQQVMTAFNVWSRDSGMNIGSINPQWKHDDTNFMTLQCRIEGSGSMKNVSGFLYEMEKSPMALRLENIEISSKDVEGQVLNVGLQVSGLLLSPEANQ